MRGEEGSVSRREWLTWAKISGGSRDINQKAGCGRRPSGVTVVLIRTVSVKLWGAKHSVVG